MTVIPYPFGLSSVMMSKSRTQGASFLIYEPRSGAGYVKNTSVDRPVFFSVTFRFGGTDSQRFWAWFSGPLQQGRLPFSIPMRTEFGLANQEVRFYAAQGDTILDHSQEGSVHTYTGTVFASSLAYPDGIEDNWDFVASPFWALRGEWDLALNSITPVAKFIELNFASRFYVKNECMVNLDEALSLSRASSGTDFVGGALTDFGVDEPRIGDGGLLIEKSATNRVLNSYAPTSWSRTLNGSFTEVISGQSNAKTGMGVATGSGMFRLTSSQDDAISVLAGDTASCSARFKITSDCVFRVRVADPTFRGELGLDMTGTSVFGILPFTANLLPDGYVDVTVSYTATVSGQVFFEFYLVGIGSTTAQPPAGAVCYMQMPQVESSINTSYIKRIGTYKHREQDNALIDISDISEKSGSYLIGFENDGTAYGRCIASAYINNQNSINAYISQSGQVVMIATKSGFSQSVFVSGTPVAGLCRVGISFSELSAIISVNGVGHSISGDWSNEMQTVALGMDDHGEMHLNSHISYFKFNPESATESELNQWTGA